MNLNNETAENVAKSLLQVRAVKLSPQKPFQWASGWNSPIYCDNRLTLSYPQIRTFIRQEFVKMIREEVGHIDVVIGVATGGIAIGALVAQDLGLPFAYVRTSAKAHGLTNQIEGVVESGQRAVVIEDLVSTGGSSLKAIEALRKADCEVKALISIFNYGFDVAKEAFKKANCRMLSLSDYDALLAFAKQSDFINSKDYESLSQWRKDPANWKK
ncbi:MAG: orotate phosphoribosyltransferase [Bacteroidetes bacterium 4572_77]|nr:MAG: orotate phosphoribosyltransferase [Bacteroidetes bacterium 4572_77]